MRLDLVEQHVLLTVVDALHRRQNTGLVAHLVRRALQRLHVLGKTRAAIPHAGIDEGIADARIRPYPQPHRLDVGTEVFRQIGHLVHEADFRRKHGVGGVLGEFRRAHIHHDHAVAIVSERFVQ